MKDGSYIESPDANVGVLKMLDYIYDNYDDFVLMFRCGQGTKYENIQEFFEASSSSILNKLTAPSRVGWTRASKSASLEVKCL